MDGENHTIINIVEEISYLETGGRENNDDQGRKDDVEENHRSGLVVMHGINAAWRERR